MPNGTVDVALSELELAPAARRQSYCSRLRWTHGATAPTHGGNSFLQMISGSVFVLMFSFEFVELGF